MSPQEVLDKDDIGIISGRRLIILMWLPEAFMFLGINICLSKIAPEVQEVTISATVYVPNDDNVETFQRVGNVSLTSLRMAIDTLSLLRPNLRLQPRSIRLIRVLSQNRKTTVCGLGLFLP